MTENPSHDPTIPPQAWRTLLPAGLVQLALLATLGWWPGATFPFPALLLFLGAFACYGVAAARVKDAVGGTVVIWTLAIAMRLVMLPLAPELSGEVFRYLWDGHLQVSGVNPYRFTPLSPDLAEFRTVWHALIENPGSYTPYPPFAQVAFFAVALAGGAVFQAKLLWLGFDLGTAWLLGRVARITGRSRRLTQLLYLWSPLLIVEVAWNAHMEPMGLFALVLIILLARAPVGAGAAAALAGLTRCIPVAALIPLGRRLGRRFVLTALATMAVLYLPYARAFRGLARGALDAATGDRFMDGPFALLESVMPLGIGPRVLAGMVVLGVALWTMRDGFRPERALFWVLGAALLITPALHPWYVLWILPLVALRPSAPWLVLTGTAFLGYYGLEEFRLAGEWPQPGWIRLLIWAPVMVLLAREAARYWHTRVPLPPITR